MMILIDWWKLGIRDAYNNIVQQLLYNDADTQSSSYDVLHNWTKYLYDMNPHQTGMMAQIRHFRGKKIRTNINCYR
jgi:hypothetical protein